MSDKDAQAVLAPVLAQLTAAVQAIIPTASIVIGGGMNTAENRQKCLGRINVFTPGLTTQDDTHPVTGQQLRKQIKKVVRDLVLASGLGLWAVRCQA